MFGIGMKRRAAEALTRGTKAALTGGFFHHSEVEGLGLNQEASAYLYTEALSHQIYMLFSLFIIHVFGKYKWATSKFALATVAEALAAHEVEQGLPQGALSSTLLQRCVAWDSLSFEAQQKGAHFLDSAKGVVERDSNADISAIYSRLSKAASSFGKQAQGMFM